MAGKGVRRSFRAALPIRSCRWARCPSERPAVGGVRATQGLRTLTSAFMKRPVVLTVWLAALVLFQVPALSQTTGSITGTVRDQTGAVIVGATVTIANEATSETRTAITDSIGAYFAALLPPGHYRVTVEAK